METFEILDTYVCYKLTNASLLSEQTYGHVFDDVSMEVNTRDIRQQRQGLHSVLGDFCKFGGNKNTYLN